MSASHALLEDQVKVDNTRSGLVSLAYIDHTCISRLSCTATDNRDSDVVPPEIEVGSGIQEVC